MIDNLIVASYLLVTLFIGVYYRSHSGSFKSFATVKDSTRKNKLMLVATIFASSVGGGTAFGLSEKAFLGDVSYSYGLIITIIVDLLVAKFILPRLSKHYGAESVGDIVSVYYGTAGRIVAGIAAMLVSIGFVAAQISVSGRIFQYILQVNYFEGVILSYSIVIIYTTIGGLRSVMFTNLLQFFAMLCAIPIITIAGIKAIGPEAFLDHLPVDKILFTNNTDLLSNTISASLGFAVMGLYPNFLQRALINHDAIQTRNAIYAKSAIYAIFLILITLNGLIAYQLYPHQSAALALPYMIDQIIPTGLQGIVVVGLLAAVMSTADSDLNVTSVSLVKDIFSPISKEKNQQKLLLIARVANVVIGSSAIIIALRFSSVVDLVVFVAGFWSAIILVPLVLALFGITISTKSMLFTSFIGLTNFLLWEHFAMAQYFALKGVFVGAMSNLLIFFIFYTIENKKDRKNMRQTNYK